MAEILLSLLSVCFFFSIPADYVRGSITHCIVTQHLIFRAEAQTTRSSFHMHRFRLVLRPTQLESIFKVWVWHRSLAGFHWSFYLLEGESQRICWVCLCLGFFLSENWRNRRKIRIFQNTQLVCADRGRHWQKTSHLIFLLLFMKVPVASKTI